MDPIALTDLIMVRITPFLKPVQLRGQPHPREETRRVILEMLLQDRGICAVCGGSTADTSCSCGATQ